MRVTTMAPHLTLFSSAGLLPNGCFGRKYRTENPSFGSCGDNQA
jgi:hypothetical protein